MTSVKNIEEKGINERLLNLSINKAVDCVRF
jgi:hypothetical protein